MTVKAKTTYTKDLIDKYVKLGVFKKKSQIATYIVCEVIMILCAAVFIFTSDSFVEYIISIALFTPILTLMIPVIIFVSIKKANKNNKKILGAVIEFEFSEEEVIIDSTLPNVTGQSKFGYDHFHNVYETKDAFYLFSSPINAVILNKSDIAESDISILRGFFIRNLPAKKYILKSNSSTKRAVFITLSVLICLSLLSGSVIKSFELQQRYNSSEEIQTIKSDESEILIDIPKNWNIEEMHELATIQASNRYSEQYFILIEETKEDLSEDFNLDDYTDIILSIMTTSIETNDIPLIYDVQIGNNKNAKQFELSGTVSKIKIKYLVTCAEIDNRFCQFVAWSTQSKYDTAKPIFKEILKSVRVAQK